MPDSLGELASYFHPGDLGPPLATEATLGALVVLCIDRMLGGVDRSLDERPTEVLGAVLGQRSAIVLGSGLDDPRAQAGVADQLLGRGEAADVPDLRRPSFSAKKPPAVPAAPQRLCATVLCRRGQL